MLTLEFEKTIEELQAKIIGLEHFKTGNPSVNVDNEISTLNSKLQGQLKKLYKNLDPWEKVTVARHPSRPHAVDYISGLITDYVPLAGDRGFAEDAAIVAGIGRFKGESVLVIGTEKGHDTDTRIKHNFGMARPEGYRKAIRLMELAERMNMPILTFVDTAGAYPGIDAEERGQAEAIARSIETCLNVRTPIISVIIGEGGSGGAIALAASDCVFMLEHSIYSVISPEGCASILWRDDQRNKDAAKALKITAQDLLEFKIIDGIIEEPIGGAHRNHQLAIENTGVVISKYLDKLKSKNVEKLRLDRHKRFMDIGKVEEKSTKRGLFK